MMQRLKCVGRVNVNSILNVSESGRVTVCFFLKKYDFPQSADWPPALGKQK